MAAQVRWNVRLPVSFEVFRSGYDRKVSAAAQGNGDHVTGDEVGGSDTQVEALANDIDQSSFRDEVNVDQRKAPQERQDERRHDFARG